MIFDDLEQAARYYPIHLGFRAGFQYLRETDLSRLAPGRHAIYGERLFVVIGEDEGRGHEGAKLEAHRRYLDIQVALSGNEEIGWKALSDCRDVETPYSDERDIAFFRDSPDSWIALPPGKFMIFYPSDAHAPLASRGAVRKAVVKVAVEW
jgi:YhcH/YjgK/YiaL family protein